MICINKVSDSCELQIVVREFHFGLEKNKFQKQPSAGLDVQTIISADSLFITKQGKVTQEFFLMQLL